MSNENFSPLARKDLLNLPVDLPDRVRCLASNLLKALDQEGFEFVSEEIYTAFEVHIPLGQKLQNVCSILWRLHLAFPLLDNTTCECAENLEVCLQNLLSDSCS
jgi:hypothetical protein